MPAEPDGTTAYDGWELADVTPVIFLGVDFGYYLIVKRDTSGTT